jgi:hypothetical protein
MLLISHFPPYHLPLFMVLKGLSSRYSIRECQGGTWTGLVENNGASPWPEKSCCEDESYLGI